MMDEADIRRSYLNFRSSQFLIEVARLDRSDTVLPVQKAVKNLQKSYAARAIKLCRSGPLESLWLVTSINRKYRVFCIL